MKSDSSPYLKEGRLADVIAAITALGLYKFYKLSFAGWAERIGGDDGDAERWQAVFRDHPEFFRINPDGDKASLVWRRQQPQNYDVDGNVCVDKKTALDKPGGLRLSRKPLEPSEVSALIALAVDMHDRALEQSKASRWWIPIVTGALAFAGGVAGGMLT